MVSLQIHGNFAGPTLSVNDDNRAGGFDFGADTVFVFFEILTEKCGQSGRRSVVLVHVFLGTLISFNRKSNSSMSAAPDVI